MAGERDAEHVPQPAPVLAPAPAAAPSAAFAGIGFAPGSLTPGQAIALQRTAGNHAVTGLLSRQPAAAPAAPPPAGTAPGASATTDKGLKHADFSTTGGDPSTSGTVTVAAEGPGGVVLNAPKI